MHRAKRTRRPAGATAIIRQDDRRRPALPRVARTRYVYSAGAGRAAGAGRLATRAGAGLTCRAVPCRPKHEHVVGAGSGSPPAPGDLPTDSEGRAGACAEERRDGPSYSPLSPAGAHGHGHGHGDMPPAPGSVSPSPPRLAFDPSSTHPIPGRICCCSQTISSSASCKSHAMMMQLERAGQARPATETGKLQGGTCGMFRRLLESRDHTQMVWPLLAAAAASP